MTIRIVQSKQNARVKELRTALLRPGRGPSGLVALEGTHLLQEALRSNLQLHTVFIAQGHENLLTQLEIPQSVEILSLPREILSSAVTTESPQPIAALAHAPSWKWSDLLPDRIQDQEKSPLLLVLAGIQDPGNLGTILRSAEAFAANGILSLSGTVSPWNPKTMRASAGSVFRLPLISLSETECFDHLRKAEVPTFAAMAHAAQPLGESNLTQPAAFVIGSEGSGLPPELAARCSARITIPCPGPVESLNAAVAASILLYEAARQRALVPSRRQS